MKEILKTNQFLKILSKTFLFNNVSTESISKVITSPECTCCLFEAGEKVYTREQYSKSLGIVLSGRLKAVKDALDGSTVVMNMFSAGGIFGVAGLFNHAPQYVSEIEAMRCSKVLFLPQTLLHRLFLEEPVAAENYIAFLSDRIYFLNTCIDHYTGGSARNRLCSFLLALPALSENPLTVELPCSMTRLADSLDIGRASLYRAFDELERDQTICRDGKKIIILKSVALKSDHTS